MRQWRCWWRPSAERKIYLAVDKISPAENNQSIMKQIQHIWKLGHRCVFSVTSLYTRFDEWDRKLPCQVCGIASASNMPNTANKSVLISKHLLACSHDFVSGNPCSSETFSLPTKMIWLHLSTIKSFLWHRLASKFELAKIAADVHYELKTSDPEVLENFVLSSHSWNANDKFFSC